MSCQEIKCFNFDNNGNHGRFGRKELIWLGLFTRNYSGNTVKDKWIGSNKDKSKQTNKCKNKNKKQEGNAIVENINWKNGRGDCSNNSDYSVDRLSEK